MIPKLCQVVVTLTEKYFIFINLVIFRIYSYFFIKLDLFFLDASIGKVNDHINMSVENYETSINSNVDIVVINHDFFVENNATEQQGSIIIPIYRTFIYIYI